MTALDEMAPSAELMHVLAGFDPAAADLDDLTAAIGAWERVISYATACQNDLLVEADRALNAEQYGLQCSDASRWYSDRLGLALGISGSSAARRVNRALVLVEKLPQVTEALRSGQVTVHHARLAASSVRVLDTAVARAVDAAVMTDDSWRTPSQLEKVLAKSIIELDPDGAIARHAERRRERDVKARNEPDGMMALWALLPAEQGQAVAKKIDAHARSSSATRQPGDDRTLAQRRADAFAELVLRDGTACAGTGCTGTGCTGDGGGAGAGADSRGGATSGASSDASAGTSAGVSSAGGPTLHGRRPEICVTVSLSTLMGADQAPAYLEGYGWIDAATATRIAADPNSVWRRLIVDPATGRLLDYGRTTYRPPQDLQDHVIARDRTCIFPTCDQPAVLCDLDHHDNWIDGGHTRDDKLHPLCRRHHRLKHEGGWTYTTDPDDDSSIWTDPTGTQHVKPAAVLPTPPPVEPPDIGDPPF